MTATERLDISVETAPEPDPEYCRAVAAFWAYIVGAFALAVSGVVGAWLKATFGPGDKRSSVWYSVKRRWKKK